MNRIINNKTGVRTLMSKANIISLIILLIFMSSCIHKKIALYTGKVVDTKKAKLNGVEVVVYKDGVRESFLADTLTKKEIDLIHKNINYLSKYPYTKTDTSGSFKLAFHEKYYFHKPIFTILFRKEGYKEYELKINWGFHGNIIIPMNSK
jgi:hypothetical protein